MTTNTLSHTGAKEPDKTLLLSSLVWIAIVSLYVIYGWLVQPRAYPVFVFFYHTIIVVSLLILPLLEVYLLLLFVRVNWEASRMFFAMLLLLLGNVTVLAPAIFIFSDEYRHHGQAWFQDQMYYLGSRWIHGGEGQSAAIFSVYQCEWVVAGCTVLHTEYYPVEAGGYRIMSASLTEYGDTLTARINDHTFFKLAS